MKQKGSLLRGNIEKITKDSVPAETLQHRQAELKKAETQLLRMEQRVFQLQDKVRQTRVQAAKARRRYKEKNTSQSRQASESAANKLRNMIRRRNEVVSQFREMKQFVRDQRATYKQLEKKEMLKQKAVAQFLKKWERDYDREIKLREKKARQRSRWLRSD